MGLMTAEMRPRGRGERASASGAVEPEKKRGGKPPAFTPEEQEILRKELLRLREGFDSDSALAREIGLRQPYVSEVLRGRAGSTIGAAFARRIAGMTGRTVEGLLRTLPERVGPPDTYPNRQVAIESARRAGIDERAVEHVRAMRLAKGEEDWPASLWLRKLLEADETVRAGGMLGGGNEDS